MIYLLLFFFCTPVTGPRRSLSLKLSDTRVSEPQDLSYVALLQSIFGLIPYEPEQGSEEFHNLSMISCLPLSTLGPDKVATLPSVVCCAGCSRAPGQKRYRSQCRGRRLLRAALSGGASLQTAPKKGMFVSLSAGARMGQAGREGFVGVTAMEEVGAREGRGGGGAGCWPG